MRKRHTSFAPRSTDVPHSSARVVRQEDPIPSERHLTSGLASQFVIVTLAFGHLSLGTPNRLEGPTDPGSAIGCMTPVPRLSTVNAPPSDLTVSTTINLQWVVNGQIQPSLTLTRGTVYTIDLTSVSDEHPFLINNLSNSPFGTIFLPGSYGSVVTFTPTDQMPVHLWYHCNVHSGMTGAINLVHGCPGNLNNDAIVNSTDFGLFVASFGGGCSGCKADINNDGSVNSTDFGLFVGVFGSSCD